MNMQQAEFSGKDELFDDTILRVETVVQHVPLSNRRLGTRNRFDVASADSGGNGNEEISDNDEDSMMLLTEIAAVDFVPKKLKTAEESDGQSIDSDDRHPSLEYYQIPKDEIVKLTQQKEFRYVLFDSTRRRLTRIHRLYVLYY